MTHLPLRAAALLALPLLAAPLLAAPGLAETPSNRPEDGAFTSQVTFRCERGAVVPVTYVNLPGAEGFAVVQIDGQQIAMKQVASGSGLRFRSVDAERPYALHAQSRAGTFFYGADDNPATILGTCEAD